MTRASISTLVLTDCFSHSLYWSWWHTSAFSVPIHSPLPLETTDWTKFGHVSYEGPLHRPEKMNWVNWIPYILWLSTETSGPERTMIYGTLNETMYVSVTIYEVELAPSGVLGSQGYEKVKTPIKEKLWGRHKICRIKGQESSFQWGEIFLKLLERGSCAIASLCHILSLTLSYLTFRGFAGIHTYLYSDSSLPYLKITSWRPFFPGKWP